MNQNKQNSKGSVPDGKMNLQAVLNPEMNAAKVENRHGKT
jgi:hypothetical protein